MTPSYEALQEQVRDLRSKVAELTGRNIAGAIRAVTGLTFTQSKIVAVLYACPGVVAQGAIYDTALADPATGDGPDMHALKVHVSMARSTLKKAGAPEQAIRHDFNFGYYLTTEFRAWLRARLEAPEMAVAA